MGRVIWIIFDPNATQAGGVVDLWINFVCLNFEPFSWYNVFEDEVLVQSCVPSCAFLSFFLREVKVSNHFSASYLHVTLGHLVRLEQFFEDELVDHLLADGDCVSLSSTAIDRLLRSPVLVPICV